MFWCSLAYRFYFVSRLIISSNTFWAFCQLISYILLIKWLSVKCTVWCWSLWILCVDVCLWIQEVVLSPTASSYSMAPLTGSTEYTVRLQAIAGVQRSRFVTTIFTTSKDEIRPEHTSFFFSFKSFCRNLCVSKPEVSFWSGWWCVT